jgi:hypothetical protein
MSIHVDDLRNTCGLLGELAADEIEDMEKAYALLFAENAKLRAALDAVPARVDAPFKLFLDWASREGYDTAYTYDAERSKWVALNPMSADLWKAWQAATGVPSTPAAASQEETEQPNGGA